MNQFGVQFIILLISAGGMSLACLLLAQVAEATRTISLKRFYSKEAGLSDLLNPAAMVSEGVIVTKNGSLIAGWEYKGDDYVSLSHEQYDAATAILSNALKRLGNGWVLHIDAHRAPFDPYEGQPTDPFPDEISRAIDQERRKMFSSGIGYRSRFVLCVTYTPPGGAIKILSESVIEDESDTRDPQLEASKTLERFERELGDLENKLNTVLEMKRLGPYLIGNLPDEENVVCDRLLEHLQYCISGNRQPVRLPDTPVYLDSILGGQEMYSGVIPKIGHNFLQVVAIEGFPEESFSGMLATLSDQSMEYRLFTRFIFLENWEAIEAIESYRKRWDQKVIPLLAKLLGSVKPNINLEAQRMVNDAQESKMALEAGEVASGYYTSGVVIYGEDRETVEGKARHFEKLINNLGFVARIETINTMEAWLSSLPGHAVENVRRPLLNTLNLAAMMPFSTVWTGSPKHPAPEIYYPKNSPPLLHVFTDQSTPFHLNLHVDDVGHSMMVGPIGTGKSTALAAIASSLRRYTNMTVFVFDKGMSMYALCKAIGGTHYMVADDEHELQFCPLQYLDTAADRAWACQWIETIAELNRVNITAAQRTEIGRAIESMKKTGSVTMSDLRTTLQDKELSEALLDYTVAGTQGQLFDSKSDTLSISNFTVFEIEELMNLSTKYCLPALLYLFRRIERSLQGQPAFIILDEAWLALAHPVFKHKIKEWLRVNRKNNCGVLMATQLLSDAIESGIIEILKDSTATRIFLPNPNAADIDLIKLYENFGLGRREIELIARARPKCDYYIRTDKHRRMIQLALGPLALSFFGVCDKPSVKEVKACEKRYGVQWPREWLKRRGISL